jgi:hypothetical protein|tara:strand:+ start:660 stop:1511 length:852 start_codon:yes stop_codon:yes gene_type:complete
MEDYHNDNIDLLNFINKKKQETVDPEPKRIFFLYTKSIRTAIINTYNQQGNKVFTISCAQLIHNIFWLIYNYSFNTKLTMFMCERAILLFNEYINISKNYGNESTNMVDVQQFIINKTVGPLKIDNKVSNVNIKEITSLSQIFEDFTYKLFAKIVDIDTFYYSYDNFMESIASILSNILYKINHIGEGEYIRDELQKILECDILDLPREVNLLKIKLELFYYSYNKTKNVVLSKQRANDILENKIDFIGESCDINEFFDWQQNINDKEFFLTLLLDLKNDLDA